MGMPWIHRPFTRSDDQERFMSRLGFAGGTIALIVGIYDRFIDALSTVVRLPFLIRSREGRTELKRALELNIPVFSYPEYIYEQTKK